MKYILIVKTGKTHDNIRELHSCFEDWIAGGLGVSRDRLRVVSVFEGGLLPPRLNDVAGVVITGSPAMVTERLAWSEAVARWLRYEVVERHEHVPVLGICYGHQLIAHALDGEVAYNPRGREIGTVEVHPTPLAATDTLFHGITQPFAAHVTHMQSVLTLPPGAVLLASSVLEPHHAFRVGERIWGLQFHPEFNADIMRAYIGALSARMEDEGLDPAPIAAAVREAPVAATVLRRFGALCGD